MAAGNSEASFSYRIESARWAPGYSLKLNREMDSGQLKMRAMISQNSGEDWNGVSLRLSTSPCTAFRPLPETEEPALRPQQHRSAKDRQFHFPRGNPELLFEDFDSATGRLTKPPRPPKAKPKVHQGQNRCRLSSSAKSPAA